MWELLELVLTKIEIKSKATQSLRDQVLNIRNRPDKAELLLNELIEDRETSNCTKCDSRHFCALFLACIYFEFDDVDQMQIYIQESIKDFSHAGSKWNKILARWIYGTILLRKNRSLSARRELEDTVEMLEVSVVVVVKIILCYRIIRNFPLMRFCNFPCFLIVPF